MERKYDVFISYRRDLGESTAKILRDRLEEKGYHVFLDVETLRSGDVPLKLYSVIDECNDFVLILSPNALDRCRNENDWVRLETERALEKKKNIIPIMLRGFSFPKELPESIEQVRYKNGLESNYEFFDAFIDKLATFLESKPKNERKKPKEIVFKRIVPLFLATVLALGAGIGLLRSRSESVYPKTEAEKNVTNSLLYYMQTNLLQLEQVAECLDHAYLSCERYLNHFESADWSSLLAEIQRYRRELNQMELDTSEMTESLKTDLLDSPFSSADAKALHDYLSVFRDSCVDNLYYMEYLMDKESAIDLKVREETLDSYQKILVEELKAASCSTNLLLLPITDEEALGDFKHVFLPGLYYFPLQAANWSYDEAVLASGEDKSWNTIDKIMDQISVQIGESNVELMKSKAELVRDCIEAGVTAEEAEQMVESLSGDSKLLTEKKAEIAELNKELDKMLDEARKKFAPAAEDDENTLWGKMLRFLNLKLYEEAENCVNAYREKMRDVDEYADIYCGAAIRMIRNISKTGIDYGLMVIGYEDGKTDNEQYQIGDVVIAFNGTQCRNYEDYSAFKEALGEHESYDVVVMREKEDGSGELEQVKLTIPSDAPRVAFRDMTEKDYD